MAAARTFSALCGGLAIFVLYRLVKKLCGSRAALLAAMLLCVSQTAIAYSQEARTYSLTLLLSLCTVWLFVIALEDKRFWWGFVGCGLLMIYTHYYAVFVLLGLLVFAILRGKQYGIRARSWVGAVLFWVIAYLPWLTSGVIEESRKSAKLTEVGRFLGVHWYTLVSSLNTFNNGLWNGVAVPAPHWTYPAGFVLLTAPVLALLAVEARKLHGAESKTSLTTATELFAILWLVPMLSVVALSALTRSQYVVRYILIAFAPYYALAAIALVEVTPRMVRQILVVSFLLFSVGALRAYYFIPTKADYRRAVAYLNGRVRPGDCIGFAPSRSVRIPRYWGIYGTTRADNRLFQLEGSADEVSKCERLWIAWDAASRRSDPKVLDQLFEQLKPHFVLAESSHFYKVDLSLWQKKAAAASVVEESAKTEVR